MQEPRTDRFYAGWLVGALEVLVAMSLAVWLLAAPPIFRLYYPVVHASTQVRDATAVVKWLSSSYRERSLNLALTDGKLSLKELHHYSDVRRVFQWFPRLTAAGAALTVAVLLIAKPSRHRLARAQSRGLLLWLVFLLVVGGLAWWDWKAFFAWLHRPFFGDRSWRLSDNAYSLKLFPTAFWRMAAGTVLLAPGVLLGGAAVLLRWAGPSAGATADSATAAATNKHQPAPAGRKPTIP